MSQNSPMRLVPGFVGAGHKYVNILDLHNCVLVHTIALRILRTIYLAFCNASNAKILGLKSTCLNVACWLRIFLETHLFLQNDAFVVNMTSSLSALLS